MKRKVLALLLSLVMMLSLLPATVLTAAADCDFTLASPTSIEIDYRQDYTNFTISPSTLIGIDPNQGDYISVNFASGTLTDGTNTVPYRLYYVEDYGLSTEWLSGDGTSCGAWFVYPSDFRYCAIKIPAGEYAPGTYTGSIPYTSVYQVSYENGTGPSGSVPVSVTIPAKYDITIGETRHGTVRAGSSWAYTGDTVVLTATPESSYYELASISATCGGAPVALTPSGEGTSQFSFVMPDGPVTVTATFRGRGICQIHIFENVWDGFDITEQFTKGEDGLFRYDLRVEGEEFDDEDAVCSFKRYDVGILIDGESFVEDDPVNTHTENYYYIFDSTEDLHLVEGDGYDGASDARPMVLVTSHKGVYHFTLDAGERTLTITHTYDDPDAEAYAYVLGFNWMDEIPYPMGNAHDAAGTGFSYGFGDPIDEEDIYDFEGEETVWMSTDIDSGEYAVNFFIGREGKTYGNRTLIYNIPSTGELRELGNNRQECRIKPDFGDEMSMYRGVYDLFYGIDSHQLRVFRRSVTLLYNIAGNYVVNGSVQPLRGTSENGITIDREGTIYSGDEVTLSAPLYRENGRMRFAGWYNAEGFTWDGDGEPEGDCVSWDNVYTFAPYDDTSLYAVYTETPFDNGYYLIGPAWNADSIDRSQRFEENPNAGGEYMLKTTLAEGQQIKVVHITNGAIDAWYPDGLDNQYTVDAAHAGNVTIYFKTDYNDGWSAFGGYFWIESAPSEPAFVTQNLILSGEIGVQFFVDMSMLTDAERVTSYMTFAISGKGRDVFAERNPQVPYRAAKGETDHRGFKCYVNALQMADTITATLHYGDGKTIEKTYSVKDYVEAWDAAVTGGTTGIEDETLRNKTTALIHALADYGHYVQLFLSSVNGWTLGTDYAAMSKCMEGSYDVDDIGDAAADDYPMTATETAGEEEAPEDEAVFKAPGLSLVLDSETAIRIFLAHKDGTRLDADAVDINVETYEAIEWETTQKGDRVMVEIRGVKATWLTETFTITVTEGSNTQTIEVCALSYVSRLLGSEAYAENTAAQNAVCALYEYAMAARDYDN